MHRRYEADGREYWGFVAQASTGCSNPAFLSDLHEYYSDKEAWRITDPSAGEAFEAMRRAGLKVTLSWSGSGSGSPQVEDVDPTDVLHAIRLGPSSAFLVVLRAVLWFLFLCLL